jgi:hypothetical protein
VIGSNDKKPTGECFENVDTALATAITHEETEFKQAAGDGRGAMNGLVVGAAVLARAGRGRRGARHRAQAVGVPVRGGMTMNARRLRTSLRGWGGVGAMAVVCALAAVFALLLPVTQSREDGGTDADGQGVAQGSQARAEDCVDPEDQSLAPDSGPQDGATSSGSSRTAI